MKEQANAAGLDPSKTAARLRQPPANHALDAAAISFVQLDIPVKSLLLTILQTLMLGSSVAFGAAPYLPQTDSEIVGKVPVHRREIKGAAANSARRATDPNAACQLARAWIQRARTEADPRYLGYAQAALTPWWNNPSALPDILVLKGIILQSQHQFEDALASLELAIRADPQHGEAWLTRATVLQVLGRYGEARRACAHLIGRVPELFAVACAANIAGLSGNLDQSYRLLEQTLLRAPNAALEERTWVLALLAEMASRRGDVAAAESGFRSALQLAPRDSYLLAAWADFLLDQNRAAEVIALLRSETNQDGLLLRLAIAEQLSNPNSPELPSHRAALRARFASAKRRGQNVHQREEARFALVLESKPAAALDLALENWKSQREPADARLVLEAALAAGAHDAAKPVIHWLRENRLEDKTLFNLIARFEPSAREDRMNASAKTTTL